MMTKLLIKNARIIDPSNNFDREGDIFIDNGKISEIGKNLDVLDSEIIDGDGLIAAPGLVDMHVHLRDPGFTYKEDIESGCRAAAAGGVTTVAAMPNTDPVIDSDEMVEYIIDASKNAKARVLPVAAVTAGQEGISLNDFDSLKKAGAVAFSDDGRPVSTAALMKSAMEKAQSIGLPVLAHCEDLSLSDGGLMNEGKVSESLGVKGIPNAAEDVGTAREIAIAASTDTSVHICHVSTAVSVDIIRTAKEEGVKVTAETCPHYFSFSDEELLKRDADYRMNPPLRTDCDQRAIVRGLVDGTIDVIATDHAPHTKEEKADFLNAPSGVSGLETSLAAGITYLVNKGCISMFMLLYKMSTVPARILGIDAGTLGIGSPADVVLFDPKEKWVVDPEKMHGKSNNTPFKGVELTGKVKYTICGGQIVYKD